MRGSGNSSLQLDAERDVGVARLNEGVDRAIKLVEQLLTLAREETAAGQASSPAVMVDLQDVIRHAVSDVLPHAAAKHIDLGLADRHDHAVATVPGDRPMARMPEARFSWSAMRVSIAAPALDAQ